MEISHVRSGSGHPAPPLSSLGVWKQPAMGSLVLTRLYNSFWLTEKRVGKKEEKKKREASWGFSLSSYHVTALTALSRTASCLLLNFKHLLFVRNHLPAEARRWLRVSGVSEICKYKVHPWEEGWFNGKPLNWTEMNDQVFPRTTACFVRAPWHAVNIFNHIKKALREILTYLYSLYRKRSFKGTLHCSEVPERIQMSCCQLP